MSPPGGEGHRIAGGGGGGEEKVASSLADPRDRMARHAGSCGAPARLGCLVLLALVASVFLLVRADASPCESITSANVAEAMGDDWSGWLNREGIVPGAKGPVRLTGKRAAKYACEKNPACKWTGGPRQHKKHKCVRAENVCDGVDGHNREIKCNAHRNASGSRDCECKGRKCKQCVPSGDLLNQVYISKMMQEAGTSDREIALSCDIDACGLDSARCGVAVGGALASGGVLIGVAIDQCADMAVCMKDIIQSGCDVKDVCDSALMHVYAPLCAFVSDGAIGAMCKACGWSPAECPKCDDTCNGALFGWPTPWPISGCPTGCGLSCNDKCCQGG